METEGEREAAMGRRENGSNGGDGGTGRDEIKWEKLGDEKERDSSGQNLAVNVLGHQTPYPCSCSQHLPGRTRPGGHRI